MGPSKSTSSKFRNTTKFPPPLGICTQAGAIGTHGEVCNLSNEAMTWRRLWMIFWYDLNWRPIQHGGWVNWYPFFILFFSFSFDVNGSWCFERPENLVPWYWRFLWWKLSRMIKFTKTRKSNVAIPQSQEDLALWRNLRGNNSTNITTSVSSDIFCLTAWGARTKSLFSDQPHGAKLWSKRWSLKN